MRRRGRLPRRRGSLFVLALIAFVSLLAGIPYAIAAKDARRPVQDDQIVHLTLPGNASLESLERARVEKIIDGDTIDASRNGKTVRIRYYGVDTPERGDKCFREATDRNAALVGKEVLLLPDSRDLDRFGRLLRYIFLQDGTSVDATLVAEGFGRAWTEDGRYKIEIIGLESQAMSEARGCLWK